MLKRPDTPKDETISQHIHDALELIRPAANQRATCAHRVEAAFRLVRWAKETEQPTQARGREQLEAVAKALRALEFALTGDALFFWRADFPREEIRRRRKFYEGLIKLIPVRSKSGPRGDHARTVAVHQARELLVMFGHAPKRTRGKAWHALAELLYGDPNADLFQNLRNYNDEPAIEIPYQPLTHN